MGRKYVFDDSQNRTFKRVCIRNSYEIIENNKYADLKHKERWEWFFYVSL